MLAAALGHTPPRKVATLPYSPPLRTRRVTGAPAVRSDENRHDFICEQHAGAGQGQPMLRGTDQQAGLDKTLQLGPIAVPDIHTVTGRNCPQIEARSQSKSCKQRLFKTLL